MDKERDQKSVILENISDMRNNRKSKLGKWESAAAVYENSKYNETMQSVDSNGKIYDVEVSSQQDGFEDFIGIPTLHAVITTKFADEIKAPFDVRFEPRNKESIPFAEARKKTFDDIWLKLKGDFYRNKALLQKIIYGDSFIKVSWKNIVGKKKRPKVTYNENGEMLIEHKEDKNYVIYDDIFFENVPPREMLIDPAAKLIQEAMFLGHDRYISKDKFESIYANNQNFKNIKQALESGDNGDSEVKSPDFESDTNSSDLVYIIDYYDFVSDSFYIIANGIFIYEGPLPIENFLPIIHYKNIHKAEDFFSLSEKDIVGDLDEEKTFHRNVIKEASVAHISPAILVGGNVDFDYESYNLGVGKIWNVGGDVQQVQPMQLGNVPSANFNVEEMFDQDIVRISGVDINSLFSQSSESATKTVTRQRTQLKRIETGLRFNSLYADARLAAIIMEFVDLYYPVSRVNQTREKGKKDLTNKYRQVRIKDKEIRRQGSTNGIEFVDKKGVIDFFDIKPENIGYGNQFDVTVTTAENLPLSRELQEQKINELLQVLVPMMQFEEIPPLIKPFIKKLFELNSFDLDEFDQLFKSKEEPETGARERVQKKLESLGISREEVSPAASSDDMTGQQQKGRPAMANELVDSTAQRSMTDPSPSGQANKKAQSFQQNI